MIKRFRFSLMEKAICSLVVLWLVFSCGSAGVITPLTFDGAAAFRENPAVDGNRVVWSDNREGLYATYLYNPLTGTETRISPAVSFSTQLPRVSGNLIVYQDDSMVFSDIYLFDILSGETIPVTADPTVMHSAPAISGNRIVWEDNRNGTSNIYLNGSSAGSESVLSLSDYAQEKPDISGDLVVWQDYRHGNWDIYLYNLATHEETQITNDPGPQTKPAIHGNRIVWMDNRNDPINSEIFINGSSPGLEYSLTPDGIAEDHQDPSLCGAKVVWQQGTSAIYMNDTSLFSSSLIPIDTLPGSIPDVPKISFDPVYGDRVVWKEASSNAIYLYTSGSSDPCPVANFSHDFAGGAAPVTVHFTDRSDPAGATHWLWDFGDGSTSALPNPSHQYTDNISYDVSLTAGNPYCRNKTLKAGSVVVGRPVADFTASPTSDIVPAVITFSDRSTGSPASWLWDFGDGGSSVLQNPVHSYSAVGSYTVTMTATNAYGSSVRTRTGYISVLKGANRIANTTIDGLAITNCGGPQSITIDKATLTASLTPNNSVLELTPPPDRGFSKITVYAFDGWGFTDTGPTIIGNVTGVLLETEEINPQGFSDTIGGSHILVSYSATLASYPCNALLRTTIWENAVAEDNTSFQKIALDSQFSHYSGAAYTTKITRTNFPTPATARFRMSVNSGWVASFTDGRNQTYIERISDDRATGEVLDTRYVSHDAGNNLDFFEAESPRGFSTFGLSALSGSGNPFQLITLSVTSHVNPPAQSNPSSDSDSGMPAGGAVATTTIPTATPTPEPTKAPLDPGRSAKVYTNAQGVVTQATRLQSTDGRAIINITGGIIAKDSSGKPLTEITIKAIPLEDLPAIPAGSTFMFAGMAYEIGPDGATFSPPISISFALPPAQWGKDYAVKSFDKKSGTWKDLPTNFDPATGTVTVQVSDFCCFALFTKSRVSPVATPVATPPPAPSAAQVKAQPPTTAVSIFASMMGWVADLVMNNLVILVAVIILVIGAFLIVQDKFPGYGR
jgi:beta propeller repeat protein